MCCLDTKWTTINIEGWLQDQSSVCVCVCVCVCCERVDFPSLELM